MRAQYSTGWIGQLGSPGPELVEAKKVEPPAVAQLARAGFADLVADDTDGQAQA